MILQTMRITLHKIEQVYVSEGRERAAARKDMARKLGIGSGTLENLFRARVKTVSADIAVAIKRLWLKTIEAELARLENERQIACQFDLADDPDEMAKVEALMEEARAVLRAAKRGR